MLPGASAAASGCECVAPASLLLLFLTFLFSARLRPPSSRPEAAQDGGRTPKVLPSSLLLLQDPQQAPQTPQWGSFAQKPPHESAESRHAKSLRYFNKTYSHALGEMKTLRKAV